MGAVISLTADLRFGKLGVLKQTVDDKSMTSVENMTFTLHPHNKHSHPSMQTLGKMELNGQFHKNALGLMQVISDPVAAP